MSGKHHPDSRFPSPSWTKAITPHLAMLTDRLISHAGQRSCDSVLGLAPPALTLLRAASEIETDPKKVLEWYRHTPIAELGELTAERLVAVDQADRVIAFLRSIRDGARG